MQSLPKSKVFVEGRYVKLSRDLPQTVFFCPSCKGHERRRKKCTQCEGYGKLTRDSVQELVGWVLAKGFGTRKHKFHGSGREDVDVRMLGKGRPFIVEMIDPKITSPDLAEMEKTINDRNEGRLEIHGLHWTEKSRVRVIKEEKHAKRYEARVTVDGDVDPAKVAEFLGQRLQLAQQTPNRVAHRRADKVRERWIEFETFEKGDEPNQWVTQVVTEHGTYVKESISGEDGRSEPSLASLLGVPCHCAELDVLEILSAEGETVVAEPSTRILSEGFGAGLE